MNTNSLLFRRAKHVFLTPMDDWKAISNLTSGVPGVYALVNKINGKVYIGSSLNLYLRLRDYFSPWYATTFPSLLINKAVVKYGLVNFAVLILETTDKDSTLKAEQTYLDEFSPEYNILKQAGRPVGYIHTEESKAKMRAKWPSRNWGKGVEVTDTWTDEVKQYKSYVEAARTLHCRETSIPAYGKSGNLLKNRYIIRLLL
jgi:excinuclease UvrABC nuclease subunit